VKNYTIDIVKKQRSLVAIDGVLVLIAILLVVQMWLLSATLELYLSGHHAAALPAAILSGILFFACAGLHLFLYLDHNEEK
jgi:hypothetical protein